MSEINSSLPIKPEQLIEILLKRHWLIIIPFCITMFIGSYLAVKLPRVYQSKTTILVQGQKVPSNIVQEIVSTDLNTRISTLSQQILSRTNLEKIIMELKLFSGPDFDKMFMEDKVAILRERISVRITEGKGRSKNADSFQISCKGTKPKEVMTIARTLSKSFIDENLKLREIQVLGTNTFLVDELENMRKRLVKNEEALKAYRKKNMGGLPEQLDSNLRILDNLNEQMTAIQSGLREAKVRLDALEQIKMDFDRSGTDFETDQGPQSLSQLKDQLEAYRNRYTEKHPDVIRLKKMVAEMDEQLKQADEDLSSGNDLDRKSNVNPAYIRQRRDINAEVKRLKSERHQVGLQIVVYKKRVEETPNREQELMSLQRDYNNINTTYSSLLGRQLEAQIAVNMEKKQKGEQFRILDPARLPQSPVEPDMKKLFLFVVAVGLGIGCGITFLLEFFDSSFKAPEDVEAFLGIPVVATIPTVFQIKEIRRKRLKLVGGILGVMFSIASFGVFLATIIVMG